MNQPGKVICRAAIVVAVLSLPNWSTAQPTPAGQNSGTAQAGVSESELRAFAKVYTQYHQLRESYEKQMSKTMDAKEKDRLQAEGNAKVKALLDTQGLTPDSYNRIFAAVNGDPQLRQRALQMVERERK